MHSYMFSSSVWWCFARQFHVLCMRCQRRLKKSQHQLPPRRCFCFLFFAAGPVLPLATSRDQMVEIGWKRLLVIRIDFVQLACTWRDTNYMYCMFKSVALGRALKYSAQSFNTSCSPEDTTDSFYTSDSTFLSPMCSLPYHQDILQKL